MARRHKWLIISLFSLIALVIILDRISRRDVCSQNKCCKECLRIAMANSVLQHTVDRMKDVKLCFKFALPSCPCTSTQYFYKEIPCGTSNIIIVIGDCIPHGSKYNLCYSMFSGDLSTNYICTSFSEAEGHELLKILGVSKTP